MSAMSIILPLAVLLLAIGWGFFIGMRRTRVRFFVVLACLIIAIITTAALKSTTYADIEPRLIPWLQTATAKSCTTSGI